jgi:hypothetical protein
MANHSLTSRTASVSGSAGAAGTGAFTITYTSLNHKLAGGIAMYVKYAAGGSTNGTAFTLTPSVANLNVDSDGSDAYQFVENSGTNGQTQYLLTAAGNYRMILPVRPAETILTVAASFTGGTAGVAVVDFDDEGEL